MYGYKFDGLDLNSKAFMVNTISGHFQLPARRHTPRSLSFQHGILPDPGFHDAAFETVAVTVFPNDEHGVVSHPAGAWGDLNENREKLNRILGKRGLIDVRKTVPAVGGGSGSDDEPEVVELQGYAMVVRQVPYTGEKLLWIAGVELCYPHPYWHELPEVVRDASSSHTFWLAGSAPVTDMRFTFAADGMVSYGGVSVGVEGLTSGTAIVDIGRREVTVGGVVRNDLFRFTGPDYWMEWPAQTMIELTATSPVGVSYFQARHH